MNQPDIDGLIEMAGFKRSPAAKTLAMLTALPDGAEWLKLVAEVAQARTAVNGQAHPFVSPDIDDLPKQGISLGRLLLMDGTDGGTVYLPAEALLEHTYVAGAPGSGKTWFIIWICAQLIEQGYRVLVFDTEGDISAILGGLFANDRLHILDINGWRRNPHQPGLKQTPLDAIARVKAVLKAQWLRDGSLNMAGEVLLPEYQNGHWPTARGVLKKLESMRYRAGRLAEYLESLTNRYRALVDYVPAYDCYEGMPLSMFLERSTCLVLKGLSLELQDFVVQDLMAAMASHLEQTAPGGLALVMVLDELHRFANRERMQRAEGEGVLFDVFRTVRKRGGAIICADQLPGTTVPQALGLTSTKVIFRLADGTGLRAIGEAIP